ncbi:hypothetical protein EVAR_79314_1 [Eumeta japonica]|uniref:Uncharacterized protein n=1 Tax=Eumeta variegata TaxID=151549 RepID=A0A4C1THQ5_EUMVA|nr:hypothetical protein EVAR_79314_1 [Eumeta japonica]
MAMLLPLLRDEMALKTCKRPSGNALAVLTQFSAYESSFVRAPISYNIVLTGPSLVNPGAAPDVAPQRPPRYIQRKIQTEKNTLRKRKSSRPSRLKLRVTPPRGLPPRHLSSISQPNTIRPHEIILCELPRVFPHPSAPLYATVRSGLRPCDSTAIHGPVHGLCIPRRLDSMLYAIFLIYSKYIQRKGKGERERKRR